MSESKSEETPPNFDFLKGTHTVPQDKVAPTNGQSLEELLLSDLPPSQGQASGAAFDFMAGGRSDAFDFVNDAMKKA